MKWVMRKNFLNKHLLLNVFIIFILLFSAKDILALVPAVDSFIVTEKPLSVIDSKKIEKVLRKTYLQFKDFKEGSNAKYIPALAQVDPKLFGISITTVDGNTYNVGDYEEPFTMQCVSKPFLLAMLMQEMGPEIIQEKIGLDATGQSFNSVMAIELTSTRTGNPIVNAGAMAVTSLVNGGSVDEKWSRILAGLSQYAGRDLQLNNEVYDSEMNTNQRNRAIAMLLNSYNRLYDDPLSVVDLYTKQCSVNVTSHDLSVMAATLANGGVNPITGEKLLDDRYVPKVLSMMATSGMYDVSGAWLYSVGLPAKSGVGGGIIVVVPGKFGIATFSPPIDKHGNSVRGQLAIQQITEILGVNIFYSKPYSVLRY